MPYARLSSYYFFHFGALGALVPYWGPYLLERGFEPTAIGALMAILMGTKILAPNVWGWLADRAGARMPSVRLGALLAVLGLLPVFWAGGFWAMAAVMAVFSFFWNAPLPLMEAVTFNHLGTRASRYASVRVWGSIGFIVTVLLLGWWQERAGSGVVPLAVLALFIGVWASCLVIPDRGQAQAEQAHLSLRTLLARPEILAFLAACLLMQASHGAYYAFYSIHLQAHGYSDTAVGALWALGVAIEVLVFINMHRLLVRFGARRLLLASLALAVLRWLLIGAFVELVAVQLIAQSLHAATFGAFHASAIHLAHHYFPGPTQGRGQALYNSVGFGVGGAAGSLIAGSLWDSAGAMATFAVASLLAGAGFLAGLRVDRQARY
ncbi:MFS transporter [Thiohalocapsa halophila]|uniref:MFS transporter n=1 Tax=Thiohalocapsa halophila TaxID=69359 RepID=A0ABS1CIW2_9GAMM|nr:MFS transporter [Thiohalocapsa halophila]MBK1631799.1 MFS transporter [Thiohalocapsa halophila]